MRARAFASAQQTAGAIAGQVRDTTGAVLPGVTVEASSPVLIEKVRTVVSDASGEYTAPSLPTGKYTVVAELTGFKKATVSEVELGVDQHIRINVKLAVGSLTEMMTVSARRDVNVAMSVTSGPLASGASASRGSPTEIPARSKVSRITVPK